MILLFTGDQCLLPDLPIEIFDHSATVIDDVPVFCGGQSNFQVNGFLILCT
jgi:hypothetical protein